MRSRFTNNKKKCLKHNCTEHAVADARIENILPPTLRMNLSVAKNQIRPISFFAISLFRAFAIAALLTAIALPVFANPYDEAMKRVRLISNLPHVRLLPFGKSEDGRRIPAYVISDFAKNPKDKARILVVSGQHGDEYIMFCSILY